jgi:hypothetical protein
VDEATVLATLDAAADVFLLEPEYRRKYPPLGLAKIATYVKARGGRVRFGRYFDGQPTDLICMTTLFTYDAAAIDKALDLARFLAPEAPILLGGVAASLMPRRFDREDVLLFRGFSRVLDESVPDYGIDWKLTERAEVWGKFSLTFTSRGCPRRCPYCAVWRLEESWLNPRWRDHLRVDKPWVGIFDNNVTAYPDHFLDLVGELVALDKPAFFENGVDVQFIDDRIAREFARLRYVHQGLRIAFDRIEDDGVFQAAAQRLLTAGVPSSQIMSYVIFNFQDTPAEADYRMRECYRLGVHPYPQRYTPLNRESRKPVFIGKHWTWALVRAFRHFWLYPGIYTRFPSFDAWVKAGMPTTVRFNNPPVFGEEDWAAWRGEWIGRRLLASPGNKLVNPLPRDPDGLGNLGVGEALVVGGSSGGSSGPLGEGHAVEGPGLLAPPVLPGHLDQFQPQGLVHVPSFCQPKLDRSRAGCQVALDATRTGVR